MEEFSETLYLRMLSGGPCTEEGSKSIGVYNRDGGDDGDSDGGDGDDADGGEGGYGDGGGGDGCGVGSDGGDGAVVGDMCQWG